MSVSKYELALMEAVDNMFGHIDEEELKKDDLYTTGKKIAYIEMFGAIQNALIVNEIDLKEYGLDFDVDNMF